MFELKRQYELVNDGCFNFMEDMPDNSVDAIITDPPYGILKHKIETDIDIPKFFAECARLIKKNGFIVYCGQQPTLTTWNYHALPHFNYKNEVIWYKRQPSSPLQDMNRVFENVMILCDGKRRFNDIKIPYTDITESLAEYIHCNTPFRYESAIKNIAQNIEKIDALVQERMGHIVYQHQTLINAKSSTTATREKKNFHRAYRIQKEGYKPRNLVSFMPHNKQRFDMSKQQKGAYNIKHPTVKPIQLLEYLIKLTTNEDDIILDPFVGSGTTILAGLQTNRRVIGIEKDSQFHLIAQQRINEYLNSQPSHLKIV